MEENDRLRNLIAPDAETRQRRITAFKQVAYYMVISVILLIILFVVPFIAGGITASDFSYYLPKNLEGWIIFWAIRAGTVVGNLSIYGLFKAQAKTNSKDNPNYIKACEIMNKMSGKKGFIPMSPKQKAFKDWSTKGLTVFITTAAESIVIGSLIIGFDVMTFLSCITSCITACLFGIVAMVKDEVYWTEEYLLYAEYTEKQLSQEQSKTEKENIEC